MNIAIFTNNYIPFSGGVPVAIKTFRDSAERKGHNVQVFAPSYPGYRENDPHVTRLMSVQALSYAGFYLPMPFSAELNGKTGRIDADIVHVHHPFLLGETGLRVARKKGIPVAFTYHTLYEKYTHYLPVSDKIAGPALRKTVTSFCNQCDLIIAPSDYVKGMLKKRGVKTRIRTIPTGINLEPYRKRRRKANIRKEYHLPAGTRILLYTGRLTKEKNLEFLIRCMAGIIREKPGAVCFLVGKSAEDDDYEGRLREIVRKANMEHKIIFTGPADRDRLVEFYNEADLFLFSSKSETQGLVILEAMAAGTPVIAVKCPVMDEFISNGRNGYTVRENVREFSGKALKLLNDSKRLRRLGANARRTAEKFSAERMADKVLKEFSRLKPTRESYDNLRNVRELSRMDWSAIIKRMITK